MPFIPPLLAAIGIGTGTASSVALPAAATVAGAATTAASLGAASAGALTTTAASGSIIPALSLGVSGAGLIASTVGQLQAGQAQKSAYEYNAKVAEIQGQIAGESIEKKLSRLMGEQRALYTKAGIELGSGSPLLMLADTAYEAEKEKRLAKLGYSSEANLNRLYARRAGGMLGPASSFLTGLSQIGLRAYESYGLGK